ncbi:MAG TPA: 16S rRNA (cytidine(1402)-2'-O)-methyltransferase [Gemmatimonadaceae bacterium]|nr:16S rRNA (cytidine(1402)-2'-O)-methyltransferase [Gemmatimonadaceae bacterium]
MTDPGATGSLYVVSTPIGNLGDMSFRAVEVLSSAALVVAEDTRHSRRLLDHYEITTRTSAYHEHNEAREAPRLVRRLLGGESIAIITDAGTPLLSDPGARLVSAAIEAGISVIPVPGASALLAALVGSGLAGEQFTFFGFLPRKGKERLRSLTEIMRMTHTAILYESPVRVGATLNELSEAGAGGRTAVVARELTKKFEEFARGTVAELAARFRDTPARGEVVILIGPATAEVPSESALREAVHIMREEGVTPRECVERLISERGAPRNLAYRLAHDE